MTDITIAVDATGGDVGSGLVLPACVDALAADAALRIVLVGPEPELQLLLADVTETGDWSSRLEIEHAPEQVAMCARPADVLRQNANTSMHRAIQLVRDGRAGAVVSGGNTGALVALARHQGDMLPGVRRLALCAQLPTLLKPSFLLDVGASVDCSPEHLHVFAKLGSALVAALAASKGGASVPSVGCLGIGAEEGKGNQLVRDTASLLQGDAAIDYAGLVEANELLQGNCDVVVCDGFVGNVALKTAEGVAAYILQQLVKGDTAAGFTEATGFLDANLYNGACLLGIDAIVIKSHGSASRVGMRSAIARAAGLTAGGYLDRACDAFSSA